MNAARMETDTLQKIMPVYLIIGTEDYIINETKQLLIDNILEGEEVEFNYANLDLEEMPIEVVIQEAESMPFFGDKTFSNGQ